MQKVSFGISVAMLGGVLGFEAFQPGDHSFCPVLNLWVLQFIYFFSR